MQVKTITKLYYTLAEMTKIKRTDNTSVCENREQLSFSCILWEYKIVQPYWESAGKFYKMLTIDPSNDPIILFLDIYPTEREHIPQKRLA